MKTRLLLFSLLLVAVPRVFSQIPRIQYSEPSKDDSRRTNFEIMGKIGADVLVYKNNRNDHVVGVYGDDMKLKETISLDFVPDKLINVDYIAYPDRILLFYQYQKKEWFCDQVVLGAGGRIREHR
ncbi:MAG: hypothetical protein QM664_05205 [Flavihumibacter sp.]